MAEVGPPSTGAVPDAQGPLPGNLERFPEYVNNPQPDPFTSPAAEQHHHPHAFDSQGRPASLSIQSVASSEYSNWSSDKDTTFDSSSRPSSIVSTTSSIASPPNSLAQSCSPQQEQPPQALTRSRRDAKQLHAVRLQRSGSTALALAKKDGSGSSKPRRFQRSSSNPADALSATEPPHEQGLTRMAFAEQQRWITVQQKTFTKWLNTKLEARGLEVKDLVQDLSDGVSRPSCNFAPFLKGMSWTTPTGPMRQKWQGG